MNGMSLFVTRTLIKGYRKSILIFSGQCSKEQNQQNIFNLHILLVFFQLKRKKTQSALNNFDEFTMLSASNLAPYIGFTEAEVKKLSEKYQQDFDEVKRWYDGYLLKDYQVYNPRAVVSVMLREEFRSYWSGNSIL